MRITESRLRSIIRSVIREGYEEDIKFVVPSKPKDKNYIVNMQEQILNGFGRELAIDWVKKHGSYKKNYDADKFELDGELDDFIEEVYNNLTDYCMDRSSNNFAAVISNEKVGRAWRENIKKGVMQFFSGKYDAAIHLKR